MGNRFKKYFAVFMTLNILFEVISPTMALALTSGPVQAEHLGFAQASSSEMVDLFTGNFNYNIPLMDVDGYPLNISYKAGTAMEDEASWVGLGWSLNPGVINRMMRGLPDDFNGDVIHSETNIRNNVTVSSGRMWLNDHTSSWYGVFADRSHNDGHSMIYNNYLGNSLELQYDLNGTVGIGVGTGLFSLYSRNFGRGYSLTLSTTDGATYADYRSNGTGQGNFGSGLFTSSQVTKGTVHNSKSGLTQDLYSKGNSSTDFFNINPIGSGSGESKTNLLPVTALSFPPRINQGFDSRSDGSTVSKGLYGCSPIWGGLSIEVMHLRGFPKRIDRLTLNDAVKNLPSYGYMNLEMADDASLMDFNRFREGVYMQEAPNGSYAALNNDIFLASAQGLGSSFRLQRSDYGIVHDPKVSGKNYSISHNKGFGYSGWYYDEQTEMEGNGWSSDGNWSFSPAVNTTQFYLSVPTSAYDRFYERTFWKELGEPTPVDAAYEGVGGGQGVSKPTLGVIGNDMAVTNAVGAGRRSTRAIRNTHISHLNAGEASDRAISKFIKDYSPNNFTMDLVTRELNSYTPKNRGTLHGLSGIDHHLSELTVTKDDGSRYVYGLPVYNTYKKNVSFNASDNTITGDIAPVVSNTLPKSDYLKIVEYTAAEESMANKRGTNNYYHKEETPAYVQAFLLTSIISPDYVDLTGNGPTSDDLGNYIVFNYSNTNLYGWRNPYNVKSGTTHVETLNSTNSAFFMENNKSDDCDDLGAYDYGTRANWYVHSIESKNYLAEFQISARDDAYGVVSDDGTIDPGSSYKLDQIRLFSKEEKIRAQMASTSPVPLKTVSFQYDYSLCNGVFNGTSGKLTLKKIYFTQGNSGKLALSPYTFSYADNNHDGTVDANPSYDPSAKDRWGSYKENSGSISNADFSYSEQDQAKADRYAASWNLTGIETPTGARTNIYYEADDYSYVQDEPTGIMLRIAGFYTSINKYPSVDYSTLPGSGNIYDCNEALIDLERMNMGIPVTLSAADASTLVKKKMFPAKKKLFMRCKTLLADYDAYPSILTKDYYEYVPCYADVEGSGIVDRSGTYNTYTNSSGTFYKYAWVALKAERIEDKNSFLTAIVNPVSRAGWEMTRTNFMNLAYPGIYPGNAILTMSEKNTYALMKANFSSTWNDFKKGAKSPYMQNYRLYKRGYSKEVDYNDCWLRAYIPYKKKIGDGHRVKKIITDDNWTSAGVGEISTTYGQEYTYTTLEGNQQISSGVASYEPLIGGDENSLHQPIPFSVGHGYSPNDHYFQETPYLENLYPNAFVGYSKVTIKNIDHAYTSSGNTEQVCQVGKTVYEFYTAKEFPVIERKSLYEKSTRHSPPIHDYTLMGSLFNMNYTAQGFMVKMNDMHGKMKSVMIYAENDLNSPISGSTYYYKCNNINASGAKELRQDVSTINENLSLSTANLGRIMDVTTDLRYVEQNFITNSTTFTQKYSICNLLGKKKFTSTSNNTLKIGLGKASTTKVIQQYGILDRVESFKEKSKVTVQNVLWDYKTGQVVLTKTVNNLDQPQYSFNYPAYWVNNGMGHKYERQGINYVIDRHITTPLWTSSGILNPATLTNVFHLGDEVFIYKTYDGLKVGGRWWITQDPVNPAFWRFMDVNGEVLNGWHPDLTGPLSDLLVEIDRPIERNTQSQIAASILSLHDPLTNIIGGTLPILNQKIIDAKAVEYCQVWDYFKQDVSSVPGQVGAILPFGFDHGAMSSSSNPIINPYSANQLGCWRPYKNYVYNDLRSYASQPNIKADGIYASYSPYYQRISGSWQTIPGSDPNFDKWVKISENYIYSPYGELLETRDGQGISHVARSGFNHTLPVLQASNARAYEVGFDSFEEYGNLYESYSAPQKIMNDYLGFYAQLNTPALPNPAKPTLVESQWHTGKSSLNFSANQTVVLTHTLECMPDIEAPPPQPRCDYKGLITLNRPRYNYQYKYLVSFWIKSKNATLDYQGDFGFNAQARDPFSSATGNATMVLRKTKVINGWQKFDYEIIFPPISLSQSNQAVFTFSVPASKPGYFLDDFRVQPYNSSMVCIVYDPVTLRPMARLDDGNFASYMEYDNSGMMVRTKKETINGVFTVNESRKSLKK